MTRDDVIVLLREAWLDGWAAGPDSGWPDKCDEWIATITERLPPAEQLYLVAMGPGGQTFGTYYDPDRATGAAKAIEGTVSPIPITRDYRPKETP